MSKRNTTKQTHASNNCLMFDHHHWHATFTVGEFICTCCGAKAICPDCKLVHPGGVRLHLCESIVHKSLPTSTTICNMLRKEPSNE